MSEEQRAALIEAIYATLWRLGSADDEKLAAIALVTGFSIETLRDLGGL